MQKQRRAHEDLVLSRELEAIVLRDLQVLDGRAGRPDQVPTQRERRCGAPSRKADRGPDATTVLKPGKTGEPPLEDELDRELREIFGKPTPAGAASLEPDDGQFADGESEGSLNEEEQDFVDRAVSWLRTRGNKDVIIARIWDTLLEAGPEDFFSPQPEESPEAAPTQPAAPESQAGQDSAAE